MNVYNTKQLRQAIDTMHYDFRKYQGYHVYLRLIFFARQYSFAFFMGILGTVIATGTNTFLTWLLKPILDKGFIARDMHFIHWLPALILSVFLVRGIANFIGDYYMAWAGRQVVMRFRQEIFQHLLGMPAQFYDQSSSGQLLSTIIYNVDQLARASTDALITVIQETCFIIGALVVMFMISWKLSLIYLFCAPLIAFTARYASLRMRRLSKGLQESMGETTQVAQEAIEGYQVIRVFGGQAYETEKFDALTSNNRNREVKVAVTNSISGSLVQQVAGIGIAIIIWVASLHGNEITAGGFAAMLTAMVTILKPMKNLSNISSSIQKGIAAAESIFEILDMPNEKDTGTQTIHTKEIQIDFEHVSFYYPGSQKKILDDINFSMPAGKTTAIIGRSGAGKSTLTKLIPHFYDQYEGKILLDHKELHDIQLQNLRAQIALVSQHIVLFNDTIANNIAYGILANTSREQIISAAKAAFAHDFIMALPHQYDTIVGDKGNLLSGGQRQRLAIARAILKNAPILILDEATSALDSESELYIQKALDDLTQNRTTMVIAHRLSTIEKADQIIVMDEGRIVERGTHSDLLKQDGAYAKLYRVQFKH